MKNAPDSLANPSDQEVIRDLLSVWVYYRDRGYWDLLEETFWPEGTISISWFDGPFDHFVQASKDMAQKGGQTKHVMGRPFIRITGRRAVAETDVTLLGRGGKGHLEADITAYARFYDLLEKRDGLWKVIRRTAIYEKDRMDSVRPSVAFSIASRLMQKALKKYPLACRYMAFVLERNGHRLNENIIEDGSDALERLYQDGAAWLA